MWCPRPTEAEGVGPHRPAPRSQTRFHVDLFSAERITSPPKPTPFVAARFYGGTGPRVRRPCLREGPSSSPVMPALKAWEQGRWPPRDTVGPDAHLLPLPRAGRYLLTCVSPRPRMGPDAETRLLQMWFVRTR